MSERWTNPERLQGDALKQWYLRSPRDVELERQEAAALRYRNFFFRGAGGDDPDPPFDREVPRSSRDIDPGFATATPRRNIDPGFAVRTPSRNIDPGFTRVGVDSNHSRGVRMSVDPQPSVPSLSVSRFDDAALSPSGAWRSNESYRPYAGDALSRSGIRQRSGTQDASQHQPRSIDPSKTPVFQTGPDGKLHPVQGWHTTGPFDFGPWSHNIDWGGVAKGLTEIGAGVAGFLSGAGLGGELLSALGPEAETAVAEGIAEGPAAKAAAQTTHSHHVNPKYMGGAADGERIDLVDELHRRFHSMLGKAHREAGFPPVGGKSGSGVKWNEHFELNPGSRDEALEILRRVSREFDDLYGTNISSKLPRAPGGAEAAPPRPK